VSAVAVTQRVNFTVNFHCGFSDTAKYFQVISEVATELHFEVKLHLLFIVIIHCGPSERLPFPFCL